jgi:hypothetical protein
MARCAAGFVVLALGTGAAGAQTSSAEDRPPLQIGPVGVRPRLVLTNVGVDNNVFNESENPKSDFTFTASPDVELSLNPGRLKFTSMAGTDFVYFKEYTSERSVNRRFSGRAEVDLTMLRPFVSVATNHTSARANAEVDVRGRHHPYSYEAGTAVKLTERTSAGVLFRRAREEYEEGTFFRGVDLSTTLNASTTNYEGSIGAQLTPFTGLNLVVSQEQIRFDHEQVRDSDSLRIAPTLTFSPFAVLNGSASAGYRRFSGRDPALPDYSGFIASGSLGASLVDRYRIEGTFTRDIRYSYEEAVPYYVLSGARGTLTVILAGGFDVRATGGRESMEYRAYDGAPSPGTDRQILYGGGIGYRLSDAAHVVVQAESLDRRSGRDAAREYSNDRIFASLIWGAASR